MGSTRHQEAGMAPLMRDSGGGPGPASVADLARLLGRLHLESRGNELLFGFGSNQDFGIRRG